MAALPGTAPCTTRPPRPIESPATSAPVPPEKVVIVVSAGLALGQAANAVAIAAGLGAGLPGWAARPLRDVDGLQSSAISHLPIIILSASDAQMAALCDRLPMEPPAGGLALFPACARHPRLPRLLGTPPGIRASRPAHAGHRGGRRGGGSTD